MRRLCSILAVLCVALAGCGTEYADTNGVDDYSLQTIGDEEIVNLSVGASGLKYSEESIGDAIYSTEYSGQSFNGVEQIFLTNYLLPSDVRVYIGYLNVSGGNFRLVVVNNDEIIEEIPIGAFNEEFMFEDISGSFAIHLAGESAEFELNISVD